MRRTFWFVVKLLACLLVGAGIFLGVLAWRLSAGPLNLVMMIPAVERLLNPAEAPVTARIAALELVWQQDAGFALAARDVAVASRNSGKQLVLLPEIAVTSSLLKFLQGDTAPGSLDIIGPHITLRRDPDTGLSIAATIGENGQNATVLELSQMLQAAGNSAGPEAEAGSGNTGGWAANMPRRIGIARARATYDDRVNGQVWELEDINVRMEQTATALDFSANGTLMTAQGPAPFSGVLVKPDGGAPMQISLRKLQIDARALAVLAPLAAPALDRMGRLSVSGDADVSSSGLPLSWDIDIASGAGGFLLQGTASPAETPDPAGGTPYQTILELRDAHLDLLAALMPDIGITGQASGRIDLRGTLGPAAGQVAVSDAAAELQAGSGRIQLRALGDDGWNYTRADLSARLGRSGQLLDVTRLSLTLPEAMVEFSGRTEQGANGVEGVLQGTLSGLDVATLGQVWPAGVAPATRTWMLAGIPQGKIEKASLALRISEGPDGPRFSDPSGQIRLRNATVRYLQPLPPVTGVSATAVYGADGFDISIEGGASEGIRLEGGQVAISGLGTAPAIRIGLDVAGRLKDALALLNRPPLGLADAAGLPPGQLDAGLRGRLGFAFPLVENLTPEMIQITADADLTGATLAVLAPDFSPDPADLRLRLDNSRMELSGTVTAAGMRAAATWQTLFHASGEIPKNRLWLQSRLSDANLEQLLGFPLQPWFRGGADVTMETLFFSDGRKRSNLSAAAGPDGSFTLPMLGWSLPEKGTANLKLTASLVPGQPTAISGFQLRAADLVADLTAVLTPDMHGIQQLEVRKLATATQDFSLLAQQDNAGGYDIQLTGRRFDAAGVTDLLTEQIAGRQEEPGTPFRLSARLDSIGSGTQALLAGSRVEMIHDGTGLQRFILDSSLGNGAVLRAEYRQEADGYELGIRADDAGAGLRALGLSERLMGGRMAVVAKRRADGPLQGEISMENYKIRNAPALVRILELLSLTGTINALREEGLVFARFKSRFSLDGQMLSLEDARSISPSIGFVFSGTYDLARDTMDFRGTVIPAYGLNQSINKTLDTIPLLGWLLSQPENAGFISATYTVEGHADNPVVRVNPLSALAPGILKRLIDLVPELAGPAPAQPQPQ